jgi:hypothetical protein
VGIGVGVVDRVVDRHVVVFRRLPFVGVVVTPNDVVRELVDNGACLEFRSGVEPVGAEVEITPDRVYVLYTRLSTE